MSKVLEEDVRVLRNKVEGLERRIDALVRGINPQPHELIPVQRDTLKLKRG